MINNLSEEELFAKGHRACAGCGPAIVLRHLLKAAGKNTVICHATGCMEVVSTPYPETAWKVPWVHAAFENAAAVAAGVEKAFKKLKKKVNVVALAGDGGTFDIGMQSLSGALERGHDFTYVCYDNGAYMNTGVQRSGATPKYAATTTSPAGKKVHGKTEFKKNIPFIIAAHKAYVATANVAFPQDFVRKVQKAISIKGPSYIQIYSPCPIGWYFPVDKTVDIARLAYKTRINPLFEIEDGKVTISMKPPKQLPVEEFLSKQKRFKHLTKEEIKEVQEQVNNDWNNLLKLEETGASLY